MRTVLISVLLILLVYTFVVEIQRQNIITKHIEEYKDGNEHNIVYLFLWYRVYFYGAIFGVAGSLILIYFSKKFINNLLQTHENYYD